MQKIYWDHFKCGNFKSELLQVTQFTHKFLSFNYD